MSNQSTSQSKTEQPTPKKLRDAKKKGDVWRSKDLSSTIATVMALTLFSFGGMTLIERLSRLIVIVSTAKFSTLDDSAVLLQWTRSLLEEGAWISAIIVLLLSTAAVLVGVIQVGAVFSMEPVMPQLSRLNPIEGAKRLFSLRNVIELLKLILKFAVVAIVMVWIARETVPALLQAQWLPVGGFLPLSAQLIRLMAWSVTASFIALAIFDVWFQRMDYMKRHRMTFEEVRREAREMEGNPEMRGKRRRMHQEVNMENMLEGVRKASVVVVNPTHIAVALYYQAGETDLPLVIAKGEDYVAQAIRDIAEEEGIPIMRNIKLARGLNEEVPLNEYIPDEFIEPVAAVLRWVRDFHGRR
jgi:type III secretion protein U